MTRITQVVILFNPNSTGPSEKHAQQLQRRISDRLHIPVHLRPTEYPRHAEEIAAEYTQQSPRGLLLISASGDGGYHELVNGVLQNSKHPPRITTGVFPSGNANDHYHAVHRGDLIERIRTGDTELIDTIKVTTDEWVHYAHSYVGLGLTPHIVAQLNKTKLNPFIEAWLVIKHLFRRRPVRIVVHGRRRRYDSLVFSNTNRMSKYLSFSPDARIDDGKFEVTTIKAGKLRDLLASLFKSALVGANTEIHRRRFSFYCPRATTIQLDGEVYPIRAGSHVTVAIQAHSLRCIVA